MFDASEPAIRRRREGSIDADFYLDRARGFRAASLRDLLRRIFRPAQSPQTSRIIGMPTSVTRTSIGRPSRQ